MRWNSLLRGMGAPGFFCYWLGAAVAVLEIGRHLDPTGRVLAIAVLVFQVDYALIQLCAGSYKSVCGYSGNSGMQLGMANPFWGHHWHFYSQMNPGHPVFRFLNQAAFRVQIGAAVLMLFPPTRWLGALAIALSFLFVMTQIRLGFLLPKVMLSALLFVPAGSKLDLWLATWLGSGLPVAQSIPPLSVAAGTALAGFLLFYLLMLPLTKFCQWYNFLEGQSLWGQSFIECWANTFGIIIWRVFSVDVVNFFVRVYLVSADGNEKEYTCFGKVNIATRGRYIQVAESIALTSIFTTLKYHPANSRFFADKLVRYARTLPCPTAGRLRFAFFTVDHQGEVFEYRHEGDYLVEPQSGSLEVTVGQAPAAAEESPVRAGARPGSYLPA